ncbi:N6-adenosine-methyltransferase TMT1A-like isoform X4 [Monodelphis domestica]|uniref:N6-adenosine-methyltransferase TMT1A-like isoform X4 n=1 Tax=Monodelphis domestica TaxID=13616 RepID=UPI0024E1F7E0|nr:N6-adenosine-methyltransferase TMT1A-like isoform X4 [Monodelphis domestica]XP_056654214.1 N6-adenosine-methyltransferase TMT1A-like isoform X4 [Monodelphis domestica]
MAVLVSLLQLAVSLSVFPIHLLHFLGLWDWICKRFFPYFMVRFTESYNKEMAAKKRELFGSLQQFAGPSGKLTLMEIGCGTGANFKFYPEGCRVTCIDPNPNFEKFLISSIAQSPHLHFDRFLVAPGEDLRHVEDSSMDTVVCTLVLCSVQNQDAFLKEVRRVLRPGGAFYFMEHVAAAPSTWNFFWQQVLHPTWFVLFDGCHLTRESWKALEQAGFSKLHLQHLQAPLSWKIVQPHILGYAIK